MSRKIGCKTAPQGVACFSCVRGRRCGLGGALGWATAATTAFAGVDPEVDGLFLAFDDQGGASLASGSAEPAADGAEGFAGDEARRGGRCERDAGTGTAAHDRRSSGV